jgi:hypothetical protein
MAAIPATQEVEIRRIMVQGQPRQKIVETPISTNELGLWYVPVIPGTWKM